MNRRRFLVATGALGLCLPGMDLVVQAQASAPPANLLSAPLELAGQWGGAPPNAAARVLARVREVALAGVRLLSDRQPQKLRVEDHSSGPPAVWLHQDRATTAWIIVDVGGAFWCQLAYQFGHELGHVLCNSWQWQARPRPPSQWLEESLAEAFSLRALALLADSWERDPPFAGDSGYAKAIRQYRQDLVNGYVKDPAPNLDAAAWLRKFRDPLEHGAIKFGGPAILGILAALQSDRGCVADLGAVNRWPARSGVPIEQYLVVWRRSCAEIGAPGRLPGRVHALFNLA